MSIGGGGVPKGKLQKLLRAGNEDQISYKGKNGRNQLVRRGKKANTAGREKLASLLNQSERIIEDAFQRIMRGLQIVYEKKKRETAGGKKNER